MRPELRTMVAMAVLVLVVIYGQPVSSREAAMDLLKAEQLYRTEGPEAARAVFESLERNYRAAGDQAELGQAERFLGEIHWRLGEYDEARGHLDHALKLARGNADRELEGKVLNILGLLHWDLGEFDAAKERFRTGTQIAGELGDGKMAGAMLNNLSLVDDELGNYRVSLEQYQKALKYYEAADFLRGEGDTLGNIGGVYLLLGRFQQALEYYLRALAISERLDSAMSKSQDHGNIGLCLLGLGRIDEAMNHLQQAATLAAGAGMRQDQAYWLRATGNANRQLGRYDLALGQYRAALDIYAQIGSRTERVEALHDMGKLHFLLGDTEGASEFFTEAQKAAHEIGLSRGVTLNLVALGDVKARQGDQVAAIGLYGQAIERATEAGEIALWTKGLLRLSETYLELGKWELAEEKATRALEMAREIGSPGLEAHAWVVRGEVSLRQDPQSSAGEQFDQALSVLTATPDPELEWRAHYGQGLVLARGGQLGEAIDALYSAIRVIEGVRDRLGQDRYRTGYLQDKYQVYVDLVNLQLKAGRPEEAFSTAERLRSRSYRDMVENGAPSRLDTRDERLEYSLRQRIETLLHALTEEQRLARPEQRQAAIGVYSEELLAAERAYQDFLEERRGMAGTDRRWDAPTYAEVAPLLAGDEALLEYVVGHDNQVVFVLTRDRLTAHTAPVRSDDLVNKVELVRNLIRRRDDTHWEKPAASLAAVLLEPILAGERFKDLHHLYVVPHGTLNYLPFALLPLNGRGAGARLVERFTLAYLPTAAALRPRQGRTGAGSSLLALAPGRSHLRYAGAEVRAVNALFAPDARSLVGSAATESAFKQEAAYFRMLHLATHGYFNKLNPLLSGLELEPDADNDGQLELLEILGLHLHADLVTLSACRTGLGSGQFAELPAGDEFVGLTRAFLHAGSRSVLATLWEVDDASTAELMASFYADLKRADSGQAKAAALANAQRALLATDRYKHPYYWAPFVLVGASAGPGHT